MQARGKAVIAGGIVLCAALAIFVDIYVAAIIFVMVAALGIAFQIFDETRDMPPRLTCWFSEDAKKVVIRNEGNARAVRIHLTLVPLDLQFDLPELAVDARHEFPLPSMIAEAKAVLTYEDASGRAYSRSIPLSSTGRSEEDLLKPAFPLFGWK
jgi:hypothetical protein